MQNNCILPLKTSEKVINAPISNLLNSIKLLLSNYFKHSIIGLHLLDQADKIFYSWHITMEILIGIKNDMRKMGLLPLNVALNLLIFSILFTIFSTTLWFFIFGANTFIEHMESGLPCYSTIINAVSYCISL